MTLIVYDPERDKIIVDSKTSWGNGRPPEFGSKIVRKAGKFGEYILTASGSTVFCEPAYQALIKAIEAGSPVVKGGLRIDSELFARLPSGKAVCVFLSSSDDGDTPIGHLDNKSGDICGGSGGAFYSAYRALGHGVEESVVMTTEHDVTCGLPIEEF